MSTRKIVANTIYYGVVPKLTFLASLIVTPLITPFLTPEDYGIQGVISSYSSLLAVIAPSADMGTRAIYFPGLWHCIRISGFPIAHHRATHEVFYRAGGTLFARSHTSISVWQ